MRDDLLRIRDRQRGRDTDELRDLYADLLRHNGCGLGACKWSTRMNTTTRKHSRDH